MMKDGKYKDLVKETYKRAKEEGNLVGILYSATQNYGFSQLINFEEFVDTIQIDMMYLKSKLTDTEINVYEWELEDYKVKHSESTIYIRLKNKPEIAVMY